MKARFRLKTWHSTAFNSEGPLEVHLMKLTGSYRHALPKDFNHLDSHFQHSKLKKVITVNSLLMDTWCWCPPFSSHLTIISVLSVRWTPLKMDNRHLRSALSSEKYLKTLTQVLYMKVNCYNLGEVSYITKNSYTASFDSFSLEKLK